MRKLFIILSFFVATTSVKSQTEIKYSKNKYFISMYNLHEKNFEFTKGLLGKLTDATSIEFNKTDSVFTILTFRTLNKKVVSGKMLKNYVPIKYFILEGEPVDAYPTFVNTGNTEFDAIEFEKQKTDWIKKYPFEYKKMIENSKNSK